MRLFDIFSILLQRYKIWGEKWRKTVKNFLSIYRHYFIIRSTLKGGKCICRYGRCSTGFVENWPEFIIYGNFADNSYGRTLLYDYEFEVIV